ncbi:hypothetical protein [Streptomyces griseosporeus]|uniref:hypothetical protein n=1 Tax=Streptomyces griseosporeus TaxID=1910 RepID=UPI00167DAB95|nr:hypothetical protein [Streptomyces griseosporeus]GHF67376.1 hypothetical protein GCM10018783_40820 [Streptomyces griseosporeus]
MDPATHPFDPEQAPRVVREVVCSLDPESGRPRAAWSTLSVAQALAERYGEWAGRWTGSVGRTADAGTVIEDLEPGGGGDDLAFEARRYTRILLRWRAWLEELASLFSQFACAPDAPEAERRRVRERGVGSVVALVVERTGAGEVWCGECAAALAWFLETTGLPPDEAEELADMAVDAEFESWIVPGVDALSRVSAIIEEHTPRG